MEKCVRSDQSRNQALTERQEASSGVMKIDRVGNEHNRGTAQVRGFGDQVREARLRWFGCEKGRDSEYVGRRMLKMGLPGRMQRGRPRGDLWI